MKIKTRQLLVLSTAFALALSISVTSCKKDKDDNGASSQFSATLGADAFKPTAVTAWSSSGYIDITGVQPVSGDTLFLSVTFEDKVTANSTVDFSDVDVQYTNWKNTKFYSSSASDSHGSVKFTTVDKSNKKVAGTFSGVIYPVFSGTDSVVIKDGKFNTTYTAF